MWFLMKSLMEWIINGKLNREKDEKGGNLITKVIYCCSEAVCSWRIHSSVRLKQIKIVGKFKHDYVCYSIETPISS